MKMAQRILIVIIVLSMTLYFNFTAQGETTSGVTTFEAPAECPIPPSPDYSVTVNGQTTFVYNTSAMPGGSGYPAINQAYCYYDTTDAADIVVVTVLNDSISLSNLVIRPRSYGITPKIDSSGGHQTITFTLPAGKKVMVDPGYPSAHAIMYPALAVFANVQYASPPVAGPNVTVLSSGTTYTGSYNLSSGQTLYIQGGAVLEGYVTADVGAHDISIMGHGIIDQSVAQNHQQIMFRQCRNVTIDGVILSDGRELVWGCVPTDCTDVTINDLKAFSFRHCNDGIDVCGCSNVTIKDCFLRRSDDCIAIKGTTRWTKDPAQDSKNILVQNCVLWNDDADDMIVGEESPGNMSIDDVTFDNIDVIGAYFSYVMCVGGQDMKPHEISNVTFSNIRVEDMDPTYCDSAYWPYDNESLDHKGNKRTASPTPGCHLFGVNCDAKFRGYDGIAQINNVKFINISVTTKPWAQMPYSTLVGQDPQNTVNGVIFQNCTLNEIPYTSISGPMIGSYPWLNTIVPWFTVSSENVTNVTFSAGTVK